ncbi:MAG: hypothetical protein VKL00_06390 [Synechococcales bacterium]|nr:hypothetical protein [Synechococcales bacterium]
METKFFIASCQDYLLAPRSAAVVSAAAIAAERQKPAAVNTL